jgi:argininosuccinate lyase
VVGRAIGAAISAGRTSLSPADLNAAAAEILGHSLGIDAETAAIGSDPAGIVAGRTVLGGSAPARVHEHCRALVRRQTEAGTWRDGRRAHAQRAEDDLIAAAQRIAAATEEL